ncbi:hypothetical protein VTL71DRAFT_16352, partial [Oculimacula yallundae]
MHVDQYPARSRIASHHLLAVLQTRPTRHIKTAGSLGYTPHPVVEKVCAILLGGLGTEHDLLGVTPSKMPPAEDRKMQYGGTAFISFAIICLSHCCGSSERSGLQLDLSASQPGEPG